MSRRTLPPLGLVADALEGHSKRQDDEPRATGGRKSGHVFTTPIGTVIDPGNLRYAWRPIAERAGVTDVFHGLRHTCVTLLRNLGVPPHIVRDIAGHAAAEVTMTIYAYTSMTEKQGAPRKIDDHPPGQDGEGPP